MSAASTDSAGWLARLALLRLASDDGVPTIPATYSWAIVIPMAYHYYFGEPNYLRRNAVLWLKLVLAVSLVCLHLGIFIIRFFSSEYRHSLSFMVTASDALSSACTLTTVCLEHRRGIRASALLGLYIAIGCVNDASTTYFYHSKEYFSLSQLVAISSSLRLVLFCLQEFVRPELMIEVHAGYSRHTPLGARLIESVLSAIRHTLGSRLWNMFYSGQVGTLAAEFSPQSTFSALSGRLERGKSKGGFSLLVDCLLAWKISLFLISVPRLCVTALLFAQPWLIRCVILSHRQESSDSWNWRLITAIFISFNGFAVFKAVVAHMKYRLLTKVRGALISRVFFKTQRLKLSEGKKHTSVALISSEMEDISNGFPTFIEFPFSIVDACLGMYLLVDIVRHAAFVIFIPLFLSTCIGFGYGKYLTPALQQWNKAIESRIASTAHVLAQFPAIKMLGLSPKVAEYLQYIRVNEMEASRKYRYIQAASISTGGFLDMITPVIIIACTLFWKIFNPELSAELVFPALGLIALVQDPIQSILLSGPSTIALIGSFRRIQEYICLEEAEDPRVLLSQEPRDVTRLWPTDDNTYSLLTRTVRRDPTRRIHFDNVSIAPFGMDTPLMSGINVSITPGSVTTLFGPTGTGKTTFLNAVLGEAEVSGGIIYVDDVSIAICGQSLWLQDMTILQFIIGALEYDAIWFRTVLLACRLVEDLRHFKKGEQHMIGNDGKKLSGGQRQRLCIARAVYTKASIILLDDALNGVDGPTAVSILYNLCDKENGILRRMNSTLLMTGYLPEFLDVSDGVLLIDAYCKITQMAGDELDDDALRLILRLMYKQESDDESDISDSESESEQQPQRNTCQSQQPPPIEEQSQDAVQRIAGRPILSSSSIYRLWVDYIGRDKLLEWFILVLVMCIAEGCPAIYMRWWVETSPAEKVYLVGYALLASTAGLLGGPCVFIMMVHLSPRASIGIHDKLNDVVVRSTLGFLSAHSSGTVLNHYSIDMVLIARHVSAGVYNNLYVGITTLFHVGIVLSGARYMLTLLPIFSALIFAIQRSYIRDSRYLRDIEVKAHSRLVTLFREIGDGLLYVRGFGWQKFTLNRQFDLLSQAQQPYYLSLCIQQRLALSVDLLASNVAAVLAALTLGIPGSSTESSSGLSFLILLIFGRSLRRALTAWTAIESTLKSLEHLDHFLGNTPVESDENKTPLPDNWSATGRVQMVNVSARYVRDQGEEEYETVIRDVTLSIEPGKKVGIMGRTGGGKSSLLLCMLGLLEYEGSIIIDGVDIRTAPLDQLRSRIITITQDPVEFEGTIEDNLLPLEKNWTTERLAPRLNPTEKRRREFILRETLVHLRLWPALEDKKGLETLVTDAGFSRGEIHLLCIARAAVHRRVYGGSLVLVDEASGGIDAWRDQVVREVIRDYFRGCTVLVVAHRAETIADSNIGFKMSQGRMQSYRNWF